jgi:hypothetical protein
MAREPGRVGPSQREARAEPNFPARLQNEPARAEPICSELNAGSHRAQPELARVQPYSQHRYLHAEARTLTGTMRVTRCLKRGGLLGPSQDTRRVHNPEALCDAASGYREAFS